MTWMTSSLDQALLRVVREELSRYGDAATVRPEWGQVPQMWFVEVEPANAQAARLSVAFDGDDLLNINVGDTWFEVFPFRESGIDDFRRVVRAIFAGRIEEAGGGREGGGTARIYTDMGRPRTVGAAFPWPWQWRMHDRYEPYGEPVPPGSRCATSESG
jgi:hypothetical protein